MSNIPASERRPTKIDFFDKAIGDCEYIIQEMQDAKVVNQQEVREILADYFKVPKESVINSKYSFIIIGYTTNNLKEAKNEIRCSTEM